MAENTNENGAKPSNGFANGNTTPVQSSSSAANKAKSSTSSTVPALARELFPMWLLVAALCASTAGILAGYQDRFALDLSQQRTFFALTLGFTIFLALSVESLMARIAGRWKWLFLSRWKWSAREVSLIIDSESRWAVIKLTLCQFKRKWWQRKGAWKIPLICILWLLIGLAAQIGLALLGVAYSIAYPEDFDSFHAKTILDSSYVANLSAISTTTIQADGIQFRDFSPSIAEQQEAAYTYGIESSNSISILGHNLATLTPDVVGGLRFLRPSNEYPEGVWFYNMSNQAELFTPTTVVISPRQIQVYSSCEDLKVIKESSVDGVAHVEFQDRRYKEIQTRSLSIRHTRGTAGSTTYATNTQDDWGPRSTRVLILPEINGKYSVISCNVTVSPMLIGELQPFEGGGYENYTKQDFLFLPDRQARLFAGAIAWNPAEALEGTQSRTFFRTSAWAVSGWNTTGNNANALGFSYAARFAMGAISAYDSNGRFALAHGVRSFTESFLVRTKWQYAGAILGLVPGILLLLLLITLWYLRDVPVRDDGAFVNALVLRHVVPDELTYMTKGAHGRVLGETDVVRMIKGTLEFHELAEEDEDHGRAEKALKPSNKN